jgi:hypothetical protein
VVTPGWVTLGGMSQRMGRMRNRMPAPGRAAESTSSAIPWPGMQAGGCTPREAWRWARILVAAVVAADESPWIAGGCGGDTRTRWTSPAGRIAPSPIRLASRARSTGTSPGHTGLRSSYGKGPFHP